MSMFYFGADWTRERLSCSNVSTMSACCADYCQLLSTFTNIQPKLPMKLNQSIEITSTSSLLQVRLSDAGVSYEFTNYVLFFARLPNFSLPFAEPLMFKRLRWRRSLQNHLQNWEAATKLKSTSSTSSAVANFPNFQCGAPSHETMIAVAKAT